MTASPLCAVDLVRRGTAQLSVVPWDRQSRSSSQGLARVRQSSPKFPDQADSTWELTSRGPSQTLPWPSCYPEAGRGTSWPPRHFPEPMGGQAPSTCHRGPREGGADSSGRGKRDMLQNRPVLREGLARCHPRCRQ